MVACLFSNDSKIISSLRNSPNWPSRDIVADGRLNRRAEWEPVIVGVALLRLSIDIAEPGRGLGLGLGGPSDSVSSAPSDTEATTTGGKSSEPYVRWVVMGSRPKRNSFRMGFEKLLFRDCSMRGFRPLARTFFLALIPMHSTSCFMASRSETARR